MFTFYTVQYIHYGTAMAAAVRIRSGLGLYGTRVDCKMFEP